MKIKHSIIICSLIFFVINLGTTCNKDPDCPSGIHKNIELKNNSTTKIRWVQFPNDSIYKSNGSIPSKNDVPFLNAMSATLYGNRQCWETVFKNGFISYMLFFNDDTVQSIGWQQIEGTNRGLLKRVKVDLKYLNDSNFTISHP